MRYTHIFQVNLTKKMAKEIYEEDGDEDSGGKTDDSSETDETESDDDTWG